MFRFYFACCISCFRCTLTCCSRYLRRWHSLEMTPRTSCSTHGGMGDTDAIHGRPASALRALSSGVPESTGLWTNGMSHYYRTLGSYPLPACWTNRMRFSLTVGDQKHTPSTSSGGDDRYSAGCHYAYRCTTAGSCNSATSQATRLVGTDS